ncbi:ABC transporter ATP-binding protein [Leifsonia sp. Leaf336]|uniref:ABC transporter ATP-binding protein n=1 Tax=Leifsonia sp. Leaf336 TaxID=1736341 RepID=UPI000A97DE50|nr:ABC transporter ATP-binding protein [Leifsonia sp. Leaf336]
MTAVVELQGITKAYGALTALDDVSLVVPHGTVHGLVGENGAGKSTLMKVLYGMVRPDSGELRIDGRPLRAGSTPAARAAGVGMVHQHFAQAESMSVLENLALASSDSGPRARPLDLRAVGRRAAEVAAGLGFELELRARIGRLSVGARQRVEIVKALQAGAQVLILDEPTAVLAPREIEELIRTIRLLAASGTAVVFVSHKLNEVVAACDEITVLRRGRVVGRSDARRTTPSEIARIMTGEEPGVLPSRDTEPGEPVLQVRDVSAKSNFGVVAVNAVSLDVRAAEIVGIAAIEGNGQDELIDVLTGLRRHTGGSVAIDGTDVTGLEPRAIRARGLAHVPADRLTTGTAPTLSIADNLAATNYLAESRWRLLRRGVMRRQAAESIVAFDVRGAAPLGAIGRLSGGNMQKVVIARETAKRPRVLVVAHPTRGVDLKAIDRIHRHILALRDAGTAVLLLSSELDELLALSDRVIVMFRGRVVADLTAAEAEAAEIGEFMTGARAASEVSDAR